MKGSSDMASPESGRPGQSVTCPAVFESNVCVEMRIQRSTARVARLLFAPLSHQREAAIDEPRPENLQHEDRTHHDRAQIADRNSDTGCRYRRPADTRAPTSAISDRPSATPCFQFKPLGLANASTPTSFADKARNDQTQAPPRRRARCPSIRTKSASARTESRSAASRPCRNAAATVAAALHDFSR